MNMNSKSKTIFLCAVILIICIDSSTIALYNRMTAYYIDDKDAIILNENDISLQEIKEHKSKINESNSQTIRPNSSSGNPDINVKPFDPNFEVIDNNQTWTTNKQIDIFKISYENGDKNISVESNNGNKLIAPGTENSYIFKLKNTGNVGLDYTVDINAYTSPAEFNIPIKSRINRYDGKWITEELGKYVDIAALDLSYDSDVLGAGRFTYYTLEWEWPYETGDDLNDTLLGDMVVNEDISFTIEIKTTATANPDINKNKGIYSPDTGDNRNILLWVILFFGSFLLLILLTFLKDKPQKGESENDT